MRKKKITMYRTVLDYGYGDKTWTNRMLTLKKLVEYYKNELGWDIEQIRSAYSDSSSVHYWEEDKESDTPDWDHLDS